MADIFGKIEGVAGLALLGGLAYGAVKFGPGIIKSFREAMDGIKSAGESAAGAAGAASGAVGDIINIVQPPNPVDGLGDLYGVITAPNPDPLDVYRAGVGTAWDIFGLVNPLFRVPGGIAKSATDAVIGVIAGAPATGIAPVIGTSVADAVAASSASAVSFLRGQAVWISGSAAGRNFDANLAKKQAEWQAAQDARTAMVKLLVQERNTALANEREARRIRSEAENERYRMQYEAQRIEDERQYNAWLQSTRPASSVSDFLNVGKQYQGQQEVAPGVYVAPSGAYQIIQDGQIVAGGSAGSVQAALDKANTAMYPGTNYRREVVEAYQAKARAGDAAASAWLKRFAPAGAV